jgi:tripartite ATP-independent transporter DctM subunit
MEWWLVLSIAVILLLILMLVGTPIAYSLGLLAILLGLVLIGPKILYLFATVAYGKINSFAIVAVPLFIFMAEIVLVSGSAKDAFDMMHKWVGRAPGGLAIASQVGCTLFAAVCGASTATTAVIGGMAVPEMLERGYDKRLATGSIAAGGALGVLIPPSLLLIIYGIAAETSIGQLFIAGVIPGLILAAKRVAYFLTVCTIKPSLGPPTRGVTWGERFASLWKILPLLSVAFFMFGALYTGICTPTEVAAVGAGASILIALGYRRLNWANLKEAFEKTTLTTCFIIWIIVAATSFGYVLAYAQIPQQLVAWTLSLDVSKFTILVFINLLLFVLGCIMDPAGIIMVTIPIFAPMMEALGFDLVWFGIMFVVNMELAEITPPLGLNLFVMKAVSPPEVTMNDIIIGSIPFMILDIVGVALVILFPSLALWLPSTMM